MRICSLGQDLNVFRNYLINQGINCENNIVDIDFSVPFHSPLLSDVPMVFINDLEFVDCHFLNGMPIANLISTYKGENISLQNNSYFSVAQQVCCQPVYWELTGKSLDVATMLEKSTIKEIALLLCEELVAA